MSEQTFGKAIAAKRTAACLSRKDLARRAKLSHSYYEKIENGRALPPPRGTCERLLRGLDLQEPERKVLLSLAAKERGSTDTEERLPDNVRGLLNDIRLYADKLPVSMVDHLRLVVRSVRK